MKRKFFVMILTASLFSSLSAYAVPTVKIDNGLVTVNTVIEPDTKATLLVVRGDGTIDDDSQVFAMKQSTADGNGNISFLFGIPEEKNTISTEGEYDFYIKQTDKEMQSGSFFYTTVKKREDVINALKDKGVDKVLDNPKNEITFKALGIEIDIYKGMTTSEKSNVLAMAEKMIDKAEKDEEYIYAINFSILLEMLNNDKSDKTDKYICKIAPEFEGETFDEISDSNKKTFIIEYIYKNRGYSSDEELKSRYNIANILYILNNARFTEIEALLEKYAEILGIEKSTEYKNYLKSSSQNKANQNLVQSLKDSPVNSVNELLSEIKKSIPDNNSSSSSGGGSTGGGGSSAGESKVNVGVSSSNSVPGISSSIPVEVSQKTVFTDLTNVKWAEDAINSLAEKGILSGDGNGKFNPDRELTREEFVKMLVMAVNIYDKNAECDFDDVNKDKWYYRYVASAYKNGMVKGISKNEFGIGKKLSRQDMAVMCCRAIDGIKQLIEEREYISFADEYIISDYAKPDVISLYKAGIINGVNFEFFNPKGTATRAQGAVIIYNLLK